MFKQIAFTLSRVLWIHIPCMKFMKLTYLQKSPQKDAAIC